ncbi:MAG: tol-pal system protein YbgF [Ancylobacter novellus]|uniref:Cell division coordinator CpoB n=1 Tax=Ancylobacter novellus TaxID=921 RepID=A0A2W5MZD5_ANCNO|nr:MAG: tol-pal system protein YbgF [Ancylobacter novellus]
MPDLSRFQTARRLALGAVFACLSAQAAAAQTAGANDAPSWLEQRVQGLENKLAFFGGREERAATPNVVQPAQASMADIAVRLDRLENQMRQLNGRIEELQFQGRKNDEALKRFQGDVDFRLQDLESGKGGGAKPSPNRRGDAGDLGGAGGGTSGSISTASRDAGPGAPPASLGSSRSSGGPDSIGGLLEDDPNAPMSIRPPGLSGGGQASGAPVGDRMAARDPGPSATVAGGGPNDQFALGVGFVQRRDYSQAEATFRDFLRSYPSDPKAAEARYWLGESLYQRRKFTDAADSFFTIYKDAPNSAKAPESMLKLGMSLNGMGKKEEACATIAEAGRKYARIKAQSDRELKRISC